MKFQRDDIIEAMTNTASEAWESLEKPWQECLNLAWEAHSLSTVPVGAVLVDPDQNIVATGGNGVYGQRNRQGIDPLLAHAEVNALSRLDPEVRYEGHTLYGSLEHCLLCVGAATVATVGTIRFAGIDPYSGASHFVGNNPAIDRLRMRIDGPLIGPFGLLAAALHVEFYLRRNPKGHVVETYRASDPGIVNVAETLRELAVAEVSCRRESLQSFLPEVWNLLLTNAR